MTRREYKETLKYELFRGRPVGIIERIRIKFFRPSTNCTYMIRKMTYLYQQGGIKRWFSKFYYLKLIYKYSCWIAEDCTFGRGLKIQHPIGIVIGTCHVGNDFTIYQNTTIGNASTREAVEIPKIGDNVTLCANSCILGCVTICDNCTIGAGSIVLNNITVSGTYVGAPARRVIKN